MDTTSIERLRPPPAPVNEAQLVDDYVLAAAQAAAADAELELRRKALIDSGLTSLRGTLNKVKVSAIPGRKSVDTKKMVSDGVITLQQLEQYTSTGAGYPRVTVSALA